MEFSPGNISRGELSSKYRVECSFSLARQMRAALHGVAVNVHIPDVSNALSLLPARSSGGKMREVTATSRKCSKDLLETVAKEASQGDVSLTTQEITALARADRRAAAKKCRYFDICLVGLARGQPDVANDSRGRYCSVQADRRLFPRARNVGALEHVVIAWDSSRVAARAVADARPFLERAAKIMVVSVTDEKPLPGKEIPDRLADGLRTRGLTVETGSIHAGDRFDRRRSTGTLPQDRRQAACHGWIWSFTCRDFVLGGATEAVLAILRLPVLLSH